MTSATLVRPDREFVEQIVAWGGGDLKRCFQCATCSVACELSVGPQPFPRKEMLWAQWGLKNRLVTDPDVWLCHQCNDCSARCPRGGRPGDVLAAIRHVAVKHYAVPQFMATWVNSTKLLPLALLLPAVLLAVALLLRGPLETILPVQNESALYAAFFPHWLLIGFFGTFTGLAGIAAVVGVARFWRAMRGTDEQAGTYAIVMSIWASLSCTLKSITLHDRFARCGAQRSRRLAHLAAFYGFLALFVVTVWAVIDLYVNPSVFKIESLYPFSLDHPMKVLANVGAVALIFGSTKAIVDRSREKPGSAVTTAFDAVFVWLLLGVGVTGVATEIFRFAVAPAMDGTAVTIAYGVYFVHLVLVFQLLVYLPYSKFAHLLYRTTAMVYAERTGRHRPIAALTAGGGLAPVAVAAGKS